MVATAQCCRLLLCGIRELTIELVRDRYADFGPTLACEKLRELHGVCVSSETLRAWMTAAGLWTTRAQRRRRPQPPRARDVGLMRVFGLRGRGLFPVRAAMAAEIEDMGGVASLGPMPGVLERYFAISVERRVRHPAVNALIESARGKLRDDAKTQAASASSRSRRR